MVSARSKKYTYWNDMQYFTTFILVKALQVLGKGNLKNNNNNNK